MRNDETVPWLDSNGEPLSTENLREISKHWSAEIWDRYAETLESAQTEFMTKNYDLMLNKFASKWDDSSSDEVEDEFINYSDLKMAFAELPSLDQAILEASVLDQLSEESIARKFGITRREVMKSKRRSIGLLENRLHKTSPVDDLEFSIRNSAQNREFKKIQTFQTPFPPGF